MHMDNIIHYAREFTAPFSRTPFLQVDSLVLAQLAYLRYERFLPGAAGDIAARPLALPALAALTGDHPVYANVRAAAENARLLSAVSTNPRYADLTLSFCRGVFDADAEKQFFGVTFLLPDGSAYVAFRGTDSTVVGWKEDMNMAFLSSVPSQEEGARYLAAVSRLTPRPLRVGGHSKGGNIAVYAAAHAPSALQSRILGVYNHDGPGFRPAFFQREGYARISARIHKAVPQSSIIGMLLQHQEPYTIVRSSGIGLLQHDPFTWHVRDGAFVQVDKIGAGTTLMDATINAWVDAVDVNTRRQFVSTVYDIISATQARTISDLTAGFVRHAADVLAVIKGLTPETREMLTRTMAALFALAKGNLLDAIGRHEHD